LRPDISLPSSLDAAGISEQTRNDIFYCIEEVRTLQVKINGKLPGDRRELFFEAEPMLNVHRLRRYQEAVEILRPSEIIIGIFKTRKQVYLAPAVSRQPGLIFDVSSSSPGTDFLICTPKCCERVRSLLRFEDVAGVHFMRVYEGDFLVNPKSDIVA
jgi:hypothetical protein